MCACEPGFTCSRCRDTLYDFAYRENKETEDLAVPEVWAQERAPNELPEVRWV